MNPLKDIIQRCHQRHEKPLRQRKTRVTPALYKGLPYNFSVYCAWRYPIRLYELEQADISFMPIGRAPYHDHGPEDFGGERFLKRQNREDWQSGIWHRSWGVQVYTGVPSERDGAQWHDIHFKYAAICNAPDAVLTCIDALVNAVANPMLTLTKSGGLRFSCRVQNYLHPNTNEAKQYIYKHIPTSENPQHRDVYLEILGDKGYSRWDARYEILIGNLVNPPIITKEVLFASIDTLRAALHQPAPSGKTELEPSTQTTPIVASLGSINLNLARVAFLKRGFSYVEEKDGIYHWSQPDSSIDDGHILLWEQDGDVWVRAAIPDTGLPMEATRITDIWDDTGILPPVPTTGLPVTDEILAVREAKLSPLGIKRPSPVLRKQESKNRGYGTLEENAVHMQQVFNQDVRILGLIAEAGGGKSYAAESYVLNDGVISLSAKSSLSKEIEQRFQDRNVSSVAHRRTRRYLWEQVKEIPAEVRMATPFQHGHVCEDPKRCEALEKKGGNPNESICPQCPVYTECQQRGYLSQSTALKSVAAQILNPIRQFLDPRLSKVAAETLESVDGTERLCIVDGADPDKLFVKCEVSKDTLEEWRVNWHQSPLGNFANALLNALETKGGVDDNPIRRVRAAVQAFQGQEATLIEQMCQVNITGRVVPREFVDDETEKVLAHFAIAFEGGAAAYIPMDTDAADRLTAKGLPVFELEAFESNEDMKIPMSMTQAIELGILDTSTLPKIRAFPTVYPDPNWTLWHQLKRFFQYYMRDADAPILWTGKEMRFWVLPVLHPSVKQLLFMSSMLSEPDLRRVFPDEEIEVHHIKPTAWHPGNRIFQIRTGIYPRQSILNYDTDWRALGMSEIGQRFFLGIQAEIEKDPHVQHAIVTSAPIIQHLQHIATKENVCFVEGFKRIEVLKDSAFEAANIIWVVGAPYWQPGITWRKTQILFGNDEKPLCYDGEAEFGIYKDERVQHVYEQNAVGLLSQIIGRAGLNRLPNKTIVLLTSLPLPDITDRPETSLFDWEDFEVAGGLDKLPETIATRERFEAERDSLTAKFGREEVEQVLGVSRSQANRILMKFRGGKPLRVPLRDQIFSQLAKGEKKTAELIDTIDGHPGSIKNELKRLVDTGEIVKVRRSMYALPPST
ncbi:hypothetical protein F4009_15095 [Candidatus Poribacteria bacterium]|nr:hypothetical protein [Candidatus Poribacteria bacterium]MYH82683.1 hypothetical protein [Candidatus Poribacteria bacterium]MYK95297.1 hypothetical protein [Candidatus Poribacteria bacterium]